MAHSYFQYFKQLQGSHHPLPHPKVIQPAKGMLPESPVTLAGLPDATSNSQRDLCKSNSVFPSKPSQVPCPKQGEVHVLPRSYVTLRDLAQLSFGRLLPSLALCWEPGLGGGSHRELIRGADSAYTVQMMESMRTTCPAFWSLELWSVPAEAAHVVSCQ